MRVQKFYYLLSLSLNSHNFHNFTHTANLLHPSQKHQAFTYKNNYLYGITTFLKHNWFMFPLTSKDSAAQIFVK